MRVWMQGLLVFVLFFAGSAAAGELEKSFHLSLSSDNGGCTSLSIGFSFMSNHQKGDRRGLLNERNYGKFAECYIDSEKHFYKLAGALVNSKWGPALSLGGGVRIYSPPLGPFRLEGGYEASLTYYEEGCLGGKYAVFGCQSDKRSFVAPLPMLNLGVSVEVPSMANLLSPFLSTEELRRLAPIMNVPIGKLTLSRRTLGWPFLNRQERVNLFSIMLEHRF
jgi:hypothetical protein